MTPPLLIPREKHHKVRPVSVWTLAKTTVAAPLVSITVLPLTMVYQTGRKLLPPHPKSLPRSLDSGHIAKNVIPRVARKYDLVLLGATGFTGFLAARYLVLHHHSTTTAGTGRPLRWALAGRSTTKLEQVKVRLAQECQQENIKMPISLDTILVDTADPTTLPALVQNTRVVATTVGPYRLYGSSVVEFCAKYGTHYVDITGEVDWVKFMVTQWQATAQHTGATLIPFCGHDSVPWDLCVQQMQKALQASANDDLATVTFWDEMKGAAPGGTYATLWEAARSPIPRHPAATMDPFLRLPDGTKSAHVVKDKSPTRVSPARSPWDDQSSSRWTGPFVMATVNAQVVRWSHALRQSNHPALTYREMQVFPDGPTAWCHLANLAAFGILLGNPLTAQWLKHAVLPRPGQGPSMQQMLHKHYLIIYGEGIGVQGNRVETILYFPRDVGCLDTARMLVESALCLLHKEASGDLRGGFWTPSTALGEDLWQRLLATGTHFNMRVVPKEDVMRSRL